MWFLFMPNLEIFMKCLCMVQGIFFFLFTSPISTVGSLYNTKGATQLFTCLLGDPQLLYDWFRQMCFFFLLLNRNPFIHLSNMKL